MKSLTRDPGTALVGGPRHEPAPFHPPWRAERALHGRRADRAPEFLPSRAIQAADRGDELVRSGEVGGVTGVDALDPLDGRRGERAILQRQGHRSIADQSDMGAGNPPVAAVSCCAIPGMVERPAANHGFAPPHASRAFRRATDPTLESTLARAPPGARRCPDRQGGEGHPGVDARLLSTPRARRISSLPTNMAMP